MKNRSKRVTLAIGTLGAGGAERNLLRLASALSNEGHVVTIMTLSQAAPDFYPLPANIQRAEVDPQVFSSPRWFDLPSQLRQRYALRQSLQSTLPDVVISFIDTCNVQILGAMIGSKVPVIVSERTDWRHHPLNWRWRLLRRCLYPLASRVVSLARAPLAEAKGYFPPWRCLHIPNPVPSMSEIRSDPSKLSGQKNLIAMGRLDRAKGFDLLLQSFSHCAPKHSDWTLTILGEGSLREELHQLCVKLDIEKRVCFYGNTSDPFPILKAGDLFVFSSRYEAFGMALAEAMACGLPVISFDCPSGPADIIRDGVDGILVPPEDVKSLASSMDRLMTNSDQRKALALRAVEVCERFAPERIYGQWCRLIDEVVQEHQGLQT